MKPLPFPRLEPDDARDFAARSRQIAAMPLGDDGGMAYIDGAIGVVRSIMYMLCGGGRADLVRDIAIYANERLLQAIGDACPEGEIVTERSESNGP